MDAIWDYTKLTAVAVGALALMFTAASLAILTVASAGLFSAGLAAADEALRASAVSFLRMAPVAAFAVAVTGGFAGAALYSRKWGVWVWAVTAVALWFYGIGVDAGYQPELKAALETEDGEASFTTTALVLAAVSALTYTVALFVWRWLYARARWTAFLVSQSINGATDESRRNFLTAIKQRQR